MPAEYIKNAYRKAAAILKRALSEGSTVRALLMAAGIGSTALSDSNLIAVMVVCYLIAAFIPDELPWS